MASVGILITTLVGILISLSGVKVTPGNKVYIASSGLSDSIYGSIILTSDHAWEFSYLGGQFIVL